MIPIPTRLVVRAQTRRADRCVPPKGETLFTEEGSAACSTVRFQTAEKGRCSSDSDRVMLLPEAQ